METFLQCITVIFLFWIGAGVFSFLYALSRRMSEKILLRQAAEEAISSDENEERKEEEGEINSDEQVRGESAETDETAAIDAKTLLGKDYVCESCSTVLKAADSIPLISYLLLKGRCRYCGAKIPMAELLCELCGGAVFELLFFRFGRNPVLAGMPSFSGVLDITAAFTPQKGLALFLLAFVFCLLFMITVIDHASMEIPNVLTLLMLAAGVGSIFVFPEISVLEHLIGLVAVSVPMALLTLAVPGAFGGGDIKLMGAAGLFLGWRLLLIALFLGILTGGCYGIYLLAKKKTSRKGHFAFGPFLSFGIAVSILFGFGLLTAYLTLGKRLYGF